MVRADIAGDGEHIAVATEYRHKELIKAVPGARWDRDTSVWRVPLSWNSCLALRGTFNSELEIGEGLTAWARRYVDEVQTPALELRDAFDAEGDPDLFPHQRADVQFLAATRRAILANTMGTGKTGATIRTLVELNRRGEKVFPALVVAPNSVKRNWAREFEKFWPGITVSVIEGTATKRRKQLAEHSHVYVMNYEALRSHTRIAPYGSVALRRCSECGGADPKVTVARCDVHHREMNDMHFRTVIADEAHRIKDPSSRQSRALKWVAREAEFRYALTGTPVANNVVDLWSILNFVDPVEWPSKTRWIDYTVDIVYNVFGGIVVSGVRADRRDFFAKTVEPRMRRMTKEVVLPFLPPILEERRDVEMTPKQRKAYDQMADHMLAELDDDMLVTTNPMLQAMRLLQLTSSYGELEVVEEADEDGVLQQRDKLVLTAPSSKIDAFMDDLPDYEGRTVIVFAVSRQLVMLLSKQLEKKGIPHGLIVGGQSDFDRQEAIDEFQSGLTKFILVTIQAGGTGINLTAADTVVYLQRSYSLIDMDQSMARAHRIGSEAHESILRVDYVAPGTIEEAVIARLEGKSAGLEAVVKDKELLAKALRGIT
jgi:SNF2 family DNA or RNA helicase